MMPYQPFPLEEQPPYEKAVMLLASQQQELGNLLSGIAGKIADNMGEQRNGIARITGVLKKPIAKNIKAQRQLTEAVVGSLMATAQNKLSEQQVMINHLLANGMMPQPPQPHQPVDIAQIEPVAQPPSPVAKPPLPILSHGMQYWWGWYCVYGTTPPVTTGVWSGAEGFPVGVPPNTNLTGPFPTMDDAYQAMFQWQSVPGNLEGKCDLPGIRPPGPPLPPEPQPPEPQPPQPEPQPPVPSPVQIRPTAPPPLPPDQQCVQLAWCPDQMPMGDAQFAWSQMDTEDVPSVLQDYPILANVFMATTLADLLFISGTGSIDVQPFDDSPSLVTDPDSLPFPLP